MYSHIYVIVKFFCLEDQGRHRDRTTVDVCVLLCVSMWMMVLFF